MTFSREHMGYFFAFVILGAVLGSALGTLATKLVPSLSIIKENLTGPIGFSFEIISFSLRINLSAIIGMVVGIIIFRKI